MKKLLLLTIAALIAFSFNSCEDCDSPIDWEDGGDRIIMPASDGFYIYSEDEIINYNLEVLGSDAEASPRLGNKDDRKKDDRLGERNDNFKKRNNGIFLGKVFRYMKLNAAQMRTVKGFYQDYMDCIRDFYADIQTARKRIYSKYAEDIMKIKRALRNNPDNERALLARLRAIHKEMYKYLRENVDWSARCNCIRELYANITDMEMTPEQKQIWKRYLNSLRHPCFTERPDSDLDR